MSVQQARDSLGTDRTIWIDDRFGQTAERLASLMLRHIEVAAQCAIPELQHLWAQADRRPARTAEQLAECLTDLSGARRIEIASIFNAALEAASVANPELSDTSIDRVRSLLGIDRGDCWDFDHAETQLEALCGDAGDATISYIVDLNEEGGSATRGLQILSRLEQLGSKGTAFILTNEAVPAEEASKEIELRSLLGRGGTGTNGTNIPICVIAKERLIGETEPRDVEEALTIALKRAGLRRSVHEVLWQARGTLNDAFKVAADRLQEIPPERLETIVVKRGYQEGVSELHVIERALTAHMSKSLRELFGSDQAIRKSAERMRSLRTIALKDAVPTYDKNLAAFYEAEVWEKGDLLNQALSPISSGDVFELIAEEPTVKSVRRFLLLGQPCDISIRPGADRKQDSAFLVCMRVHKGTKLGSGEEAVPFPIDGERWKLQFLSATMARLAILDLASFREDGKVQIDFGQQRPQGLLDGLDRVYDARVKRGTQALSKAIADEAEERQRKKDAKDAAKALKDASSKDQASIDASVGVEAIASPSKYKVRNYLNIVSEDPMLQLTLSAGEDFNIIRSAYCGDKLIGPKSDPAKSAPQRITWRLRRCGRIRMPYSAAFLERHISNISRRAFDLEYMSEVFNPPVSESEVAAQSEEHTGILLPQPTAGG